MRPEDYGQADTRSEGSNSRAWKNVSNAVHKAYIAKAQMKGALKTELEVTHFLALALCGEAGELANLIKKHWRGEQIDMQKIRDEIADVQIYLHHLAEQFNCDIDRACMEKINRVTDRL